MKRRIFLVCLFYCFFRLPIYESIAAIFWQSASYVYWLLSNEFLAIILVLPSFMQFFDWPMFFVRPF